MKGGRGQSMGLDEACCPDLAIYAIQRFKLSSEFSRARGIL